MTSAILHPDGLHRCPWPEVGNTIYVDYHDQEWGVPEWDDRALFEKLVLDGFQAGLSWITILRKRENFRRAFDGFQPEKIARYDARKKAALMKDAGIVRNKLKVEGAVLSARAYLDIMEKGPGSLRCCGTSSTANPRSIASAPPSRCRLKPRCRRKCPRNCCRAASSSWDRPLSMLSCRRSAWSTTIW